MKLGQIPERTRIYIAGPIHGYENNNRDAFDTAKKLILNETRLYPVSPLDIEAPEHHGEPCPGGDKYYTSGVSKHTSVCHLRADIRALCDCDSIYMLTGWPASVGARAELNLAATLGLNVVFEEK